MQRQILKARSKRHGGQAQASSSSANPAPRSIAGGEDDYVTPDQRKLVEDLFKTNQLYNEQTAHGATSLCMIGVLMYIHSFLIHMVTDSPTSPRENFEYETAFIECLTHSFLLLVLWKMQSTIVQPLTEKVLIKQEDFVTVEMVSRESLTYNQTEQLISRLRLDNASYSFFKIIIATLLVGMTFRVFSSILDRTLAHSAFFMIAAPYSIYMLSNLVLFFSHRMNARNINYRNDITLTRCKLNLNTATNGLDIDLWKTNKIKLTDQSEFVADIRSKKSGFQLMLHMVMEVFKKNGISIRYRSTENQLYVAEQDIKINQSLAKKINAELLSIKNELDKTKEMKRQLLLIANKLNLYFMVDQFIKDNRVHFSATSFLDRVLQSNQKEVLLSLFKSNIHITHDKINIKAFELIPEEALQVSFQLAPKTSNVVFRELDDSISTTTHVNSVFKQETKAAKPAQTEFQAARQKTIDKIKTWDSATYDPAKAKNAVYVFATNALPSCRFFATSRLSKQDFANDPILRKHFKDQIANPTLARERNDQGFVLNTFGFALDGQGNSFQYQAKIKLKGHGGDARVYCDKETNEKGEVLYIAKGVNLHAH